MSNNENKVEVMPVGNTLRAIVFMGLGLVSIIIGLILTPSMAQIAEGFRLQQTASGLLDLNTFLVVGDGRLGVPFINAGILVIVVMLSYLITKTTVNGGSIAAAFMVFGFGFCGKTLWNVWPLFFGVLLHAKLNKKAINTVTGLGWFSAALSPMVSIMTFYIVHNGSSNETIGETARFSGLGFVLAIVIGLIAGYLVAVFAGFLPDKHTGLTLYNAGFAAGLAGFLIFSIMKVIGLGHTGPGPYHDFPNINNKALAIGIAVLLIYLMLCGLLIAVKERGKIDTIVAHKYAGSAVEQFGFGATLVNMSVCGFFCLLYWALTITANAHGPLFACLFTVTGFAANGISVRTMAPIFAGVYAMSFGLTAIKALLTGVPVLETAFAYVGSKNMLIAAIFGCGMAPVVYRHGALIGFFAGMIHSVLVPNTGGLHGWMNLYNNGFCLGLVVTFFVPMVVALLRRNNQEKQ
ncbi:MAG: DUF1576 domain-containing protein [Lachnospiraceae bacterium]|nr:DUF1576 domain-containing protein [Lachnospiraceae bacterium]